MAPKTSRRNRYLLPVLILVLYGTLRPGDGANVGFQIDKLVHFLLFFGLAINLCYTYDKTRFNWILVAILFGLSPKGIHQETEVAQQFIPGRNMDLYDGIADTLGIMCAFFLYERVPERIDGFMQILKA